jgi:hypothetical protein
MRPLLASVAGDERATWLLDAVAWHPALLAGSANADANAHDAVPRAVLAQALNVLLLDRLLTAVPTGAAYVEERVGRGERVHLDHGAVRTVSGVATGDLPQGPRSITRVLRALGYAQAETYNLDRLRMTGYAWRHLDRPAHISQFFVSELHVGRFSTSFALAAERIVGQSTDPIDAATRRDLVDLEAHGALPRQRAEAVLPALLRCFTRRHPDPGEGDYLAVLAESAEMAWIATEGTAFNHATDRVPDVLAVAAAERDAGRPVKDEVEVSTSGRVLQTAHRAALVSRAFRTPAGATVDRDVPGSFFEFIERRPLPNGDGPDLAFDAANAQAIFGMTGALPAPAR